MEASRINEDPERKISVYWLWKILKKNGFSNRAISSIGRKTLDEGVVKEFLSEHVPTFLSQPRNLILNMDETCVQFEVIPKRTYDLRGSTNTRLVTAGLEKKSFTVVLTVTADGEMLTPYVIHKLKKVPSAAIRSDLALAANESGWMNNTQLFDWYKNVILLYLGIFDEVKPLLLLDAAPAHNSASTTIGCDIISVPKGHTSVLQPLDISVMKPFKACLRRQWVKFVIKTVRETGTPRRPSYTTLSEMNFQSCRCCFEKCHHFRMGEERPYSRRGSIRYSTN